MSDPQNTPLAAWSAACAGRRAAAHFKDESSEFKEVLGRAPTAQPPTRGGTAEEEEGEEEEDVVQHHVLHLLLSTTSSSFKFSSSRETSTFVGRASFFLPVFHYHTGLGP